MEKFQSKVVFVLLLSLNVFAATHPLEPLTEKELQLATDLLKKDSRFPAGALFPMVALKENPKAEILAFKKGQKFSRSAEVIVLDRKNNKNFEATVDLNEKKVTRFDHVPGQPFVLIEEYDTLPKIIKADARRQEAMKKRGINNFDDVQIDGWAPSHLVPKDHKGKRIMRGLSYFKGKDVNFYGKVIEGVVAVVDMGEQKVIEIVDTGVFPVPAVNPEFDEAHNKPLRSDLKPLKISQPKGVSFKLSGNQVEWQNWRFRFNVHPREGLTIHQVEYKDKGTWRSILYRGSLSEMVVPYGDPSSDWYWRNAFDVGEYGLGRSASSIEPHEDAPENATLIDALFSDDYGKAYVLPQAVAVYEKDDGFLWKHYDSYAKVNHSRRARSLVVFMITTIGNYDYALNWIFKQDGEIQFQAQLSGIMLPKGVKDDKLPCDCHNPYPHGHLVAPHVLAPHHQHFFNVRLDMDVDGQNNRVLELNTRAMDEGDENPMNNGIIMDADLLVSEKRARRDPNMAAARKWKIQSMLSKQSLGYRRSYALIPEGNSFPYLSKESGIRKRAPFLEGHFWSTVLHEEERYGADEYPNQSDPEALLGLKKFVDNDELLEDQDLVLWYTFGITHTPRPEEWPVMTVHKGGFTLIPVAFFDQNPAMDLPLRGPKKKVKK